MDYAEEAYDRWVRDDCSEPGGVAVWESSCARIGLAAWDCTGQRHVSLGAMLGPAAEVDAGLKSCTKVGTGGAEYGILPPAHRGRGYLAGRPSSSRKGHQAQNPTRLVNQFPPRFPPMSVADPHL